jgi:hypothetical protein
LTRAKRQVGKNTIAAARTENCYRLDGVRVPRINWMTISAATDVDGTSIGAGQRKIGVDGRSTGAGVDGRSTGVVRTTAMQYRAPCSI